MLGDLIVLAIVDTITVAVPGLDGANEARSKGNSIYKNMAQPTAANELIRSTRPMTIFLI